MKEIQLSQVAKTIHAEYGDDVNRMEEQKSDCVHTFKRSHVLYRVTLMYLMGWLHSNKYISDNLKLRNYLI